MKNIAIIAHVDHGKTTMVDQILRFCSATDSKEDSERMMDSNDLERERGITILAKNTAINYEGTKINVVDTPGHSDFGGEVERVLKMVDTCLLLVDAMEGPMPQTRFVLKKALELNHKVILVLNKEDKPGCDKGQLEKVINDVFDLFVELNANDEQCDFPVIYASAKNGYAYRDLKDKENPAAKTSMKPMLEMIMEHARESATNSDQPFSYQVTNLDYNDYLGRICIGRIFSGSVKLGEQVTLISENEKGEQVISKHKVTKLFSFLGLKRHEVEVASAPDIIAIAGIPEMSISDTLVAEGVTTPLKRINIEPPTVSMQFWVNDSPFVGKEGKLVTSRNIRERLERELKTNLSLRVEDSGDSFKVYGRGELQLAILIENMRREGFELSVSKPEVIIKMIDNQKNEPFEELVIDMPQEYSGGVIQELNRRKGMMSFTDTLSSGYTRVKYEIPTRGIIGFRSFFLTETRGEGSMSSIFLEFRPYAGPIPGRTRGAIVSMEQGATNAFALFNIQERGDLFVPIQTPVYIGMIIGIHAKEQDIDVNPIKEKKLSNMRSSGTDEALRLVPHKKLSLEQALDFLESDEALEVTPQSLRLRKKQLNPSLRKR